MAGLTRGISCLCHKLFAMDEAREMHRLLAVLADIFKVTHTIRCGARYSRSRRQSR
ncbi:hypothetical protein AGR9A_Lc40376 [Agrobacterium salinitolerans str. Hayward 0363]|nr:hypothetical protein AGR9A_Lc40376 [Agrobacterium salinitolerans str. Hayward 0363]